MLFTYVLLTPWIKGVEPNRPASQSKTISTRDGDGLWVCYTIAAAPPLAFPSPVPLAIGPMYNNAFGSPPITNNPFISDLTNAQSRFPDLSTGSATQSPWPQAPTNAGMGYQQSQGMFQQPSFQQQQPQLSPGYTSSTGYLSSNPSQGIAPQSTGLPFQPTSSFGQQLAASMNGTSYGYVQRQTAPPQQQSYQPVQQQLQSPGYISQFDPYASVGQGWSGESHMQTPMQQNQSFQVQQNQSYPQTQGNSLVNTSSSLSGVLHPREYLRTHKGEIEAWDAYAWKQLLSSFDSLKEAWEGRAKELEGKATQLSMQLQYGNAGYHPAQVQQEGARLQGLHKEAKSHVDSVAASAFQMQEVFEGYRQSGDVASKRRVREASNAALQALPDWPSSMY
ncbi:hypothetical protein C0995_008983 [Termitomyces sp. Mi166|nr:hypothetical protein C0995_008983 [Termitomyces sp. Mi166\